jgi:hypothetical protein
MATDQDQIPVILLAEVCVQASPHLVPNALSRHQSSSVGTMVMVWVEVVSPVNSTQAFIVLSEFPVNVSVRVPST